MFERFDDPEAGGFVPDDGFRAAVDRRGRRLRRRRRVATAGVAAITVVGLAAGTAALYVARRDAAIDRIDVATRPSTDGAVNVLLLGSDARPPDDPRGVTGARADTIAVLRLDDTGTRLLSIPRDLMDADGRRINAGLDGGVQGMLDAVWRTTGIPIDHVVALDFQGFAALIDATGGIEVSVTYPVRDERVGLSLDASGCTQLDGAGALALVRSRHLERFDEGSGTWVVDPSGDLGRIARQQAVLDAIWQGVAIGPADLDALSRVLADHAVLDAGLTFGRLVELGRRLLSEPMLGGATLPVEAASTEGGATVLEPAPEAAAYAADFGADGDGDGDGEPIEPDLVPPAGGIVPIASCLG